MNAQHGVETVVGRFRADVARSTALLAFGDDVAFLAFRFSFGLGVSEASIGFDVNISFRVHTVSATAAASDAAAMLTRFLASAAWISASGSSTFIMRHCSLANFCRVAMCSAWRWPKRPCSFRYSETGRMLAGRKL